MKLCCKCKDFKSFDKFRRDKTRKDRLRSYCKNCSSEIDKLTYKKRRDQKLVEVKKYSRNNRDIRNANQRKRYQENPGYFKARDSFRRAIKLEAKRRDFVYI